MHFYWVIMTLGGGVFKAAEVYIPTLFWLQSVYSGNNSLVCGSNQTWHLLPSDPQTEKKKAQEEPERRDKQNSTMLLIHVRICEVHELSNNIVIMWRRTDLLLTDLDSGPDQVSSSLPWWVDLLSVSEFFICPLPVSPDAPPRRLRPHPEHRLCSPTRRPDCRSFGLVNFFDEILTVPVYIWE